MMSKNQTADLIVITSYPQEGLIHGNGTVGIASYTKNTLLSLLQVSKKKHVDIKITVLAEKLRKQKQNSYLEDGIAVHRIWERGKIFVYLQLLLSVLRFHNTRKIILAFELSMFGSFIMLSFLPLFLFVLKLIGKEIFFIPHQVVNDINGLSGHIGLARNSFRSYIINNLINIFYKLTLYPVSNIIVFENYLKEKLSSFSHKDKIVVIPHGVQSFSRMISNQTARRMLGLTNEYVILYFGFIAWYKGTDWIVNKIKDQKSKIKNQKIKLIIAGGENPNHKDKKFYIDYVRKIQEMANRSNGKIVVTGFIKEQDIAKYFIASDLVILPYRTFMSSSGPLSLAFSFNKPMVLSQELKPYSQTLDFKEAMDKTNADPFRSLVDANIKKLTQFSKIMAKKRAFNRIGQMFYDAIFNI